LGRHVPVSSSVFDILRVPAEMLDKLVSQAEIIEWAGMKAVKKRFTKHIGLLKWVPAAIVFRAAYRFAVSPRERLRREVTFFSRGWGELLVPRVLSVDEDRFELVREFIDGRRLDPRKDCRGLGTALGSVHGRGAALGDTKLSNFLVVEGRVAIIDAEQSLLDARPYEMGWDLLLTALFLALFYITDTTAFRSCVEEFISAYVRAGGRRDALDGVGSVRNSGLAVVIPLMHLHLFIKEVEEAKEKAVLP